MKRLYTIHKKIGGRWIPQSNLSFPKEQAIRVFQSTLLDSAFTGKGLELRPLPKVKETVNGQV